MLRGDKEPRRSARPLSALLGFRMGGVMEGYMLWAIATSAGAPILYRRFRLYLLYPPLLPLLVSRNLGFQERAAEIVRLGSDGRFNQRL